MAFSGELAERKATAETAYVMAMPRKRGNNFFRQHYCCKACSANIYGAVIRQWKIMLTDSF